MKRIALFFLTLAFAAAAVSCNDPDVDQAHFSSFVTVHLAPSVAGYYFETDNGKTIFPGDTSRIGAYQASEGQRAIIAFNLLDNVPGYDYNAAIYGIGHIYSSAARVVSTEEELEAVADDPAQYLDGRLLGRWVTMTVRCAALDLSKHKFYLIVNNAAVSKDADEEYLSVELHHDNSGDPQGESYDIFVSFDMAPIAGLLDGMKGIRLRYYDGSGARYAKIDRLILSEETGL